MFRPRLVLSLLLKVSLLTAFTLGGVQAAPPTAPAAGHAPAAMRLQKRWLFFWRDMNDPQVVNRVIADFPRAQADGYNAVVFGYDVAPSRAAAFRQAAKRHGLGLVAMVMGGAHDRNDTEGVPARDALFVARGGVAAFQPDNPTRVVNGDFEDARGDHFGGWGFQDDEGQTTFADHQVTHGGKTSLRMEGIGKNPAQHARIEQPIRLQPYRQYRVSF